MTAGPQPGTDTVYHHTEAENLPPHGHHDAEVLAENRASGYWRANLRVLAVLLGIWAFVAVGCGVLFGAWLDRFQLGGFPLGFWFTQQGAMLVFIALIAIYHLWMTRLERIHGVDDDPDAAPERPRR